MTDKIAVIDFGGQYAHLIANRVRRLGVYSEILEPETSLDKLAEYKGLIFSGGPRSVYEKGAPTIDPKIFLLNVPVLGICYGHQLIGHLLKGKVTPGKVKEYGLARLNIKKSAGIFKGFSKQKIQVWMSHGDAVSKIPPGFTVLGSTSDCPHAAFGDTTHHIYGVQFHIEVVHTPDGMKILSNFLDLTFAKRDWSMEKFLGSELQTARQQVGKRKVFFLVSGGVDSTVAFTLLNKALGKERAYGLFVDTGFLRKDEGRKVKSVLHTLGFRNFHTIDASKRFYKALEGVTDPEEKRKIIGNLFLEVQKQEVKRLKLNPDNWLLGQGTIYPDTIETGGTKHAAKIKTHHNRVPEIEALLKKGLVIEPLKNLYKDEVREVGEKLGLPAKLVWRHPFPGPGLAVRILCAKRPHILPEQKKVEKSIEKFCHQKSFVNLSARILPIRSVGVQGDDRTYRHPVVLADKSHNWDKWESISTDLTNRFREINRVCLGLFPEKVSNIAFHEAYLTLRRIKLLQTADDIVMKFIHKYKIDRAIWQFPVVLLPLSFSEKSGEAILLRPVVSKEAMTANFYKMDWNLLWNLANQIRKIPGISGVLYDITNKPPGTIEWE